MSGRDNQLMYLIESADHIKTLLQALLWARYSDLSHDHLEELYERENFPGCCLRNYFFGGMCFCNKEGNDDS